MNIFVGLRTKNTDRTHSAGCHKTELGPIIIRHPRYLTVPKYQRWFRESTNAVPGDSENTWSAASVTQKNRCTHRESGYRYHLYTECVCPVAWLVGYTCRSHCYACINKKNLKYCVKPTWLKITNCLPKLIFFNDKPEEFHAKSREFVEGLLRRNELNGSRNCWITRTSTIFINWCPVASVCYGNNDLRELYWKS